MLNFQLNFAAPPKRGGERFRVPWSLKKEGDSSCLTMRQLQQKINRAAEASAPLVLPLGVLTVPLPRPPRLSATEADGPQLEAGLLAGLSKAGGPTSNSGRTIPGGAEFSRSQTLPELWVWEKGSGAHVKTPLPRALLTPFKACSEFDSRYLGTVLTEGDPAIRLLGAALGPKTGLLYWLALLPGEREQVYKTL